MKKERKIIMITQNMMMENPSTPNHFVSLRRLKSLAMNKENKKQDKIGLSLQKNTFSRRIAKEKNVNIKQQKEISIWNALYAL